MRMAIGKIINCLRRFSTILATLVVGCAFVFASGVNAGASDRKAEIKKPEKIEKIEMIGKILKGEGLNSSKPFVNELGVVVNEVDFNPFFRPFDDFFIVDVDQFAVKEGKRP